MMKVTIIHLMGSGLILAASVAMALQDEVDSHLDHSSMQMQGGSAPADARDPHAYSGGFTLTEGPYTAEIPQQLKLADEHYFWSLMADHLEYNNDTKSTDFDIQAWMGPTYDRLVIKADGEITEGNLDQSQLALLWGHALTAHWDTQLGVSQDQYQDGENRRWLAFGIQGLAPYWFEIDATAYVGDSGRTALALKADYEILFTQGLILQAMAELKLYGQTDEINGIGSGLSQVQTSLRLRYELSRQFAPYLGIERMNSYDATGELATQSGQSPSATNYVAGVRFWF